MSEFLTIAEAAERLGVKPRWLRELLRRHPCTCYRFGGPGADPRFKPADVGAWADQFRIEAPVAGSTVPATPHKQKTSWAAHARKRLTGTENA